MRRQTLKLQTNAVVEVIDLSSRLNELAANAGDGLCVLFMKHMMAALTLASLEDEAPRDLKTALSALVPQIDWRHLPAEHGPAHILSAIIGATLTVPVEAGRLTLGRFQRVVLIELQGPGQREIDVQFWSSVSEGA